MFYTEPILLPFVDLLQVHEQPVNVLHVSFRSASGKITTSNRGTFHSPVNW